MEFANICLVLRFYFTKYIVGNYTIHKLAAALILSVTVQCIVLYTPLLRSN